MILRLLTSVILLAISITASSQKQSYNMVFIGNSITYGAMHQQREQTAPPAQCARWLSAQDGIDTVYFANCGRSGRTTYHFLPNRSAVVPKGDPTYFGDVVKKASQLTKEHPESPLVFSIMLGTNDSAERPKNHRTSPDQYVANMTALIDSLLTLWPDAHVVLQRVIYYTPGYVTKMGSVMDDESLRHLSAYYDRYAEIIRRCKHGHVHVGDTLAYDYFRQNYKTDVALQHGKNGEQYYLHPNEQGAKALGEYWGRAILSILQKKNTSDCISTVGTQNVLEGKKWVACGDSFTHGDFNGGEFAKWPDDYMASDKYYDKEWKMYKTYPWWIARRNNMRLVNEARNGTCMACNDTRKDNFADGRYKRIAKDADYITLWFGINDRYRHIPIGDIESKDSTTFYGAWNIVLEYLIEHHPYAKIGIIITNGSLPQYTEAERKVAERWGIPYLDLERDPHVPLLIRNGERKGLCDRARELRNRQLRAGEKNTHPSLKAHELQSTVIENFLRSL